MYIKGIKKGRNIQLSQDIDIPDGQEVLINLEVVDNFWTALIKFRKENVLEQTVDHNDPFADLRDKSTGREVIL
jgi:hypothetical protein